MMISYLILIIIILYGERNDLRMHLYKKIEIDPTDKQKEYINDILEKMMLLRNMYITTNNNIQEIEGRFIYNKEFDHFVCSCLIYKYPWIKDIPNKARQHLLLETTQSYIKYFNKKVNHPKIKDIPPKSFFFIKNGIRIKKDEIWIPNIHFVKMKEQGYLKESDIEFIKSGRLIKSNNKYFISLHMHYPYNYSELRDHNNNNGISIDWGIINYLTIYNGDGFIVKSNINKSKAIISKIDRISRLTKIRQKKFDINHTYNKTNNIIRLNNKINNLYAKITNIRHDYIKKIIHEIISYNPKFIIIEKIEMMKLVDKHFKRMRKSLYALEMYYFFTILKYKCKSLGIELRIANKDFPSSKLCSKCGEYNTNLKLSDRVFKCPYCGFTLDRNKNAALNLYYTTEYKKY